MKAHEADTLKTRPTLLSKVKKGDEEGWRQFYELYEGFIYAAARATGLLHEEASDVLQEVMVTVQNYVTHFVPDPKRGRFRTWLRRIVQSRIADQFRRRRRSPLDLVNDKSLSATEETGTSATNRIPNLSEVQLDRLVDEQLECAILEEARANAKAAVRMEDYQAYDLFSIQHLTAQETAVSLGIHPTTVRVRAFRVRRMVERELRRIGRALERPNSSKPARV